MAFTIFYQLVFLSVNITSEQWQYVQIHVRNNQTLEYKKALMAFTIVYQLVFLLVNITTEQW